MQIVDTTDSIDNNNDDKEEKKLYSNFIYSIKTEVSRKLFVRCLKYYMKFLGVSTLRELVSNDKPQKIIESDIKDYLIYLRNQKKNIIHYCFFVSICSKKILFCEFRLQFQMESYNFIFGK